MMIIDPVAFSDVAWTRPSPKWVFDKSGTLVQVPAGAFALAYNPGAPTNAPYAVVEPSATNLVDDSSTLAGAGWAPNLAQYVGVAYDPTAGGTGAGRWSMASAGQGVYKRLPWLVDDAVHTFSFHYRAVSGGGVLRVGLENDPQTVAVDLSANTVSPNEASATGTITPCGNGWFRVSVTFRATQSGNKTIILYSMVLTPFVVDLFGAQVETGIVATSYIPTTSGSVTRAADAIAAGAGLVFSNVPITEVSYSSAATYAQNSIVYDPTTYLTYQSLIANNTGKVLTDTASWTPLLKTVNRWLMFDQYNNTQTTNAEEIIVVLSPQALAQGVFLGNVDSSEVRISTFDPTDGLVHQETQDLIIQDSASSFYNWCFKRIRKKSYAISVQLPPYYTGLVTITLRKPGGTAKCGMCVLGPLVDVGLSQYGLSREIKDYSTVNFNFDGTSNVVKRNFAKIMDVDVLVDNDVIDSVIESLEGYRQKPVAWIGAAAYGSACLYGTYTSFKSVIQYPTQSAMNLQIQGTV